MIIVQSIYNQKPELIEELLKSNDKQKTKFLLTPELDFKKIDNMQNHNVVDLR